MYNPDLAKSDFLFPRFKAEIKYHRLRDLKPSNKWRRRCFKDVTIDALRIRYAPWKRCSQSFDAEESYLLRVACTFICYIFPLELFNFFLNLNPCSMTWQPKPKMWSVTCTFLARKTENSTTFLMLSQFQYKRAYIPLYIYFNCFKFNPLLHLVPYLTLPKNSIIFMTCH